jgi:chemotaxis protein MotB
MRTTTLALTLILTATGCVSKGTYNEAVADAKSARDQMAQHDRQSARELNQRAAEIDQLRREMFALQKALETSTATSRRLQKGVDDGTAMNQQLRAELTRLGRDVDKLLSDKGYLSSQLEDAKARLEELRRAQAAAEARAALFRKLALKFERMINAGELAIVLRDGRMTLQLSNDVLFDSGKTTIKPAGKAALEEIAGVLSTIEGRRFQVAGHTDDEPIRQSPYASNWELSTARGLAVVQFLIENGVLATAVSAAGYGEFDPVADNGTREGMAKNRRIEIVLQPNIDELVTIPEPR